MSLHHASIALTAVFLVAPAQADCQHIRQGQVVSLHGIVKPYPVKLNEYQNSEFAALHFDPPACIEGRTDEVADVFVSGAKLGPGRVYAIQDGKESDFSGAFVPPEPTDRIKFPLVFRVDAQSVTPPPPPTADDLKRYAAQKIAGQQACVRDQDAIMANEREVGRISGVVNMETLHRAAEIKLYCERDLAATLAACRKSKTCP